MLLKTGRIGLRGRQMGGRSPRTMMCLALFVGCAGWLVTTAEARQDTAAERPPVQVYILAGQSNMEGKGSVVTVEKQLNDPERRDRFAHLKDGDSWAQRDDVWIHYLGNQGRRSVMASANRMTHVCLARNSGSDGPLATRSMPRC